MSRARNVFVPTVLALLVTAVTVSAASANELAAVSSGPTTIEWSPVSGGAVLTLAGPEGFYLREELEAGEMARFDLFDAEGSVRPDGVYTYELRPVVVLDHATRAELEPRRNDPGFDALVAAKAGATSRYQSGSFAIFGGTLVPPGAGEEAPTGGEGNELARKQVLANADGVVRDALCVGPDCPSNPTFDDSTVLLMSGTNRIKLGDTDSSPDPNRDWEIEANSALSSGASYLAFNDCGSSDDDGGCADDPVFGVEAGARERSIWVDDQGRVGFGTAIPTALLHAVSGSAPRLRLDQDTSSGFSAQTWDLVGNHTSFAIRDETHGTQPFQIYPDNDSSRIVIRDDHVGIGTSTPGSPLEVVATGVSGFTILRLEHDGAARMRLSNSVNGETWNVGHALPGGTGFVLSDVGDPVMELYLDVSGNLTIAGTLTTTGTTCGGGGCDLVFDPETERTPLTEHAAAMWTRGHLPAVGPTPENRPLDLTAKVGGIIHELEMAHIYIEELHGALEAKGDEVADLRARLERLEAAQAPGTE